jgi:hypothetical protein
MLMAIGNLTNKSGGNSMEYAVGMELWFEPDKTRSYGKGHAVQVEKVGRKWVTIAGTRGWRISLGSDLVESPGYGRVGQVYPSQEAWADIQAQQLRRNEVLLRLDLGSWRSPISRLSTESLQAIEAMLKSENLIP